MNEMPTSLFLKTLLVVWDKALPVYLFCHLNNTVGKKKTKWADVLLHQSLKNCVCLGHLSQVTTTARRNFTWTQSEVTVV